MGSSGIWGCLATGLFAEPTRTELAYGAVTHYGLFYEWGPSGGGSNFDAFLLLNEILGILFIIGWCTAIMLPFFFLLNLFGLLRVDSLEEEVGLDISHHKGAAYDLDGPSKTDVEELVTRHSDPYDKNNADIDKGSDNA